MIDRSQVLAAGGSILRHRIGSLSVFDDNAPLRRKTETDNRQDRIRTALLKQPKSRIEFLRRHKGCRGIQTAETVIFLPDFLQIRDYLFDHVGRRRKVTAGTRTPKERHLRAGCPCNPGDFLIVGRDNNFVKNSALQRCRNAVTDDRFPAEFFDILSRDSPGSAPGRNNRNTTHAVLPLPYPDFRVLLSVIHFP